MPIQGLLEIPPLCLFFLKVKVVKLSRFMNTGAWSCPITRCWQYFSTWPACNGPSQLSKPSHGNILPAFSISKTGYHQCTSAGKFRRKFITQTQKQRYSPFTLILDLMAKTLFHAINPQTSFFDVVLLLFLLSMELKQLIHPRLTVLCFGVNAASPFPSWDMTG